MSDDTSRVEELTLAEPGGGESRKSIADHMRKILESIGEDTNRDGLRRTPERFEKAFRFLTSGYQQDPEKLLNGAMFTVSYDQMVLVKDIEFYSLCEHHLLPFFGRCHVAYIPDKKVVGLSKIPRLVNMFARRLHRPGTPDESNCQRHPAENRAARSGCGRRGAPSLHGDARGGKGKLANGNERDARFLQGQSQNAREFLSLIHGK